MSSTPLRLVVECLCDRELANLATILELDQPSSTDEICERIRWLYWSKTRAQLSRTAERVWNTVTTTGGWEKTRADKTDQSRPVPTWDVLIAGLAQHLKVHDAAAGTELSELYISHALIVRALNAMTPVQRKAFFDRQPDPVSITGEGVPADKRLVGPMRTLAAIGAANAAGFSLYAASSSALGLVTHAVGVKLPFAAFTGLSSSIAFLIGPAGWLGAGAYAFWKVTSTNWEDLAPAIVYLINARAAKALKPLASETSIKG